MNTTLKRLFINKPYLIEEVRYYFCCDNDLLSINIEEILILIKYNRWQVIADIIRNPQKKLYVCEIINYCKRLKI